MASGGPDTVATNDASRLRPGPRSWIDAFMAEPDARDGVTATFGAENSAATVSWSRRPLSCALNFSNENSSFARLKLSAPDACACRSTSGFLPVSRNASATSPGVCPSSRPVFRLSSAMFSSWPVASSR